MRIMKAKGLAEDNTIYGDRARTQDPPVQENIYPLHFSTSLVI